MNGIDVGDSQLQGYLNADYILTGKVTAIFTKNNDDATYMIAVKDKDNSEFSNYMHVIKKPDTEMIRLATTAARLGEDVRLYGKKTAEYTSHVVVGLGMFYEEPVWWVTP